ncbi:MAG: hypothetical protein K2Q22_16045 [Cytophagales bacterium]|nr:hypothetical protein [Cytophagales bacterium]
MRSIPWIFFVLVAMVSCGPKEEVALAPTGLEYFPLKVGDTAVYQVARYDTAVNGNVIASNYFLKEVVQDTFVDAQYGISYKVDRYKSPVSSTSSWVYDSTWYSYKNNFEAVRVENNVPYVKLSFPIKNNKEWDGNMKNVYGENMYKMINVDRKYQLGSLEFPKSLLVLQTPDTTYDRIVGQNKRLEVYAANVGLVFKQAVYISINSSVSQSSPARSGVNYSQKLISYGKR